MEKLGAKLIINEKLTRFIVKIFKNKTVLIQGAFDMEIEYVINLLQDKKIMEINEYQFFIGTIGDVSVIVSKTLIGTINATIATCIGITNFNPDIVINQGIAGSHREDLHIDDIVIGQKCYNINSYKMPIKSKGSGSNPFGWKLNKRAKDVKCASSELVYMLKKYISNASKAKVFTGILGSGDVYNREYDRIKWINNQFHNLCEDMESIGVYSVYNKFNIPCIGIRIISNNELLSGEIKKEIAIQLQKILINILIDL